MRTIIFRWLLAIAALACAQGASAQSDTIARGLATQAKGAATAAAVGTSEFETNAADFLKAAKPLIKFVPANLRAQLLAGANGSNAPDYCPYIQYALETYRVVDLQGLQVNCKTPISLSGFEVLLMNGGRLWANMTTAGDPVFKIKSVAAGQSLVAQFYLLGFGSVTGPATAFSMKQPYVVGNGIKLVVENVTFNGLTRAANTRWLDAELVDFVYVKSVAVSNYDQGFRFTVPSGVSGSRGNTQIIIDGTSINYVNSLGYISDTALARINTDSAFVGGGLVIGPANGQLVFDRPHIEAIAYDSTWTNAADEAAGYARFGWGIYLLDGNAQQGDIVFHDGSVFGTNGVSGSSPGTPIGGVYIGKNDNGTLRYVTLRNFYIAPTTTGAANWIPLEAHYNFRWEGKWISALQNNVRLGNSGNADPSVNDQVFDAVVDEGQLDKRGSRNLLPGSKAGNLVETLGTGTVAIADVTAAPFEQGQSITFTATTSTERYRSVYLDIGWHTMLVAGNRTSGTVFASVRSTNGTDWPLRKQFQNGSSLHPITFHMPFYVPTANTYRVGFQASSNGAAVIDELGLVKGFWPGDVPAGAWAYPPVLTLPTCSARYEGQGLTLLGASNDNHAKVCMNTTSGYAWVQVA